jgi:uncharacterized membrane protein
MALPMLFATETGAQRHPEKPTYQYEKCHGVVRAGKNDCFTAKNSCAGTSKTDAQRDAWIYMPAGTCEKIVDGKLKPTEK